MSVCVIIAAYNASGTIERAVESALAQDEVSQVIVVDDCSSDGSAEIIQGMGDKRVVVLRQGRNAGPAAARNRALEVAEAEWVAILDADDFMEPGRIAGLLSFADEQDMVADNLYQVDEADIDGARSFLIEDESGLPKDIGFEEFVRSNISKTQKERGELGFIKPIIRRDFIEKNSLRYQEHMRLGEDYEFYCRAFLAGARLKLVSAQGYVLVVREDSLSGAHSEADLQALRDCNEMLMQNTSVSPAQKKTLRQHYLDTDCRLQWRLLINAVKQRDVMAAIGTFMRPWPVPISNLKYLCGETCKRTAGALFRNFRA